MKMVVVELVGLLAVGKGSIPQPALSNTIGRQVYIHTLVRVCVCVCVCTRLVCNYSEWHCVQMFVFELCM